MKFRSAGCVVLMAAGTAIAAAFPKGDSKAGKLLFDEAKCGACHTSMMGGDGNRLFTRPDRKIKNTAALLKQVQFCAAQVGAQWFAEDEQHVAAYLNQSFYKLQ